MSGIGWHIFVFITVALFLVVIIYRTTAIGRLPVHLRWELAPIPREKGKGRYGGSYLEEYEWWRQRRRHSFFAPIFYMLAEVLLLKAVWKNNRALWPLSLAFHGGIYLIIFTLVFSLISALLAITGVSRDVVDIFLAIAGVLAAAGYILGGLGALGLLIKRVLDTSLRSFNTVSKYFNLVFLLAGFVTGAYARFASADFASELSLFIKGVVTLDTAITLTPALAAHAVILLLFAIYLPFTDMIHFVAKYFTYHEIRWNDAPKDEKMVGELNGLLRQPVDWSAVHVKADGRKNWVELTVKKTDDDEET